MPILINRIKLVDPPATTFDFWAIRGVPQLIMEQGISFYRPGVDGIGIQKQGKRNAPFTLRTEVDQTTHLAGALQYQNYTAIPLGGQVEVIKNSVSYGQFHILGIVCRQIRAINGIINGLNVANGLNGVIVECEWQMVPEATTPAAPT